MNKTPKKMGPPVKPAHLRKSVKSYSLIKTDHEYLAKMGGSAYLRKLVASDIALRGGDSDA